MLDRAEAERRDCVLRAFFDVTWDRGPEFALVRDLVRGLRGALAVLHQPRAGSSPRSQTGPQRTQECR